MWFGGSLCSSKASNHDISGRPDIADAVEGAHFGIGRTYRFNISKPGALQHFFNFCGLVKSKA